MATKKTSKKGFDPGFTPVDLAAGGMESLSAGKCELKRVDCASGSCEEQTLALVFRPDSWGYPLVVYMGEDVPGFTAATPWEEILKEPVETRFTWLGKSYKASVRLGGGGTAVVEVREPLSARSFRKTPFAWFCVELEGRKDGAAGKPAVPGAVYAVSVASYYGDDGELTSHCDVFGSAEEAADWFEADWNWQAGVYGGRKLARKAKRAFLDALEDEKHDFVAEAESPDTWGGCRFKWKGVRTEI